MKLYKTVIIYRDYSIPSDSGRCIELARTYYCAAENEKDAEIMAQAAAMNERHGWSKIEVEEITA